MIGTTLPFGILVLEREPAQWQYFAAYLQTWLQDAGGFAAIGLLFWILYRISTGIQTRPNEPRLSPWLIITGLLTLAAYAAALGTRMAYGDPAAMYLGAVEPIFFADPFNLVLMAAGTIALIGLSGPFVADLFRMRWGRIRALATIAFKEAIRRRVLWVFVALLLVFLFPANWFFPIKPEDELRTTIGVVYTAMTPLMLLFAMLLASFSIPSDVRSQTIHTIVTKPVQRFEIVVGRFLGFAALLTIILAAMTVVSFILISSTRIDPQAEAESKRARVPVYGRLGFLSTKEDFTGVSVGREWEYRKYIAGGPRSTEHAAWSYFDVPSSLATQDGPVPLEFAFDIFRTTKGQEGRGVFCTFTAVTWSSDTLYRGANFDPPPGYEDAARQAGVNPVNARPGDERRWQVANDLAEEYGFFQFRNKEVVDYQTFSIELPPGLFANAIRETPERRAGEPPIPLVRIFVKCESSSQYVGVADKDLYLLEGDGSFAVNFFKGVFGLWFRLCLVIGVAVAVSTYLSGVISFLLTLMLLLGGFAREFIQSLAMGVAAGGGPLESLNRLVTGQSQGVSLDPTPGVRVILLLDEGFLWVLRRVFNVIPDVDRFSFADYVAEGFNVPFGLLALNFVFLVGYLLPWALLAYYLMRSREIATW